MYNICIVEDEKELRDILSLYLINDGFHVESFEDIASAKNNINKNINLYILDIMLPDGSGFELLTHIRENFPDSPVILISARGDDIDKILGLEMGCDDYIAKPFMPRELVLRVKRILSRVSSVDQKKQSSGIIIGNYIIDENRRTVSVSSAEIDLSSLEFDLLMFFIKNSSIALSRDTILKNVWGEDFFGNDRVVDNSIKRIRKKLPDLNIETIYGYGYRLNR